MSHIHIPDDIPVRYLDRSGTGKTLALALIVVGALSFGAALFTGHRHEAMIAWAANWLFFTSVSIGAVLFVVSTTIVKAKWDWSTRRVSIAFAAYLPFAFLTMLPMLGLGGRYFPWVRLMATDALLQKTQAWLNMPFLVARNLVGAAVLFGMGIYIAYLMVRPDMDLARAAGHDDAGRTRWRERLTAGWRGQEVEEVESWRRLQRIGPLFVYVYAAVMSMFAYDWAMSLEPHWYSTLFGGWFFMGAYWTGIAVTAFTACRLIPLHPDFRTSIGIQQRWDLGKLAFGFTVFWTYLFWSQYLPIWYGKIPHEQIWMVKRAGAPWGPFSALTIVLCFVVPFAGLLGKQAKIRPGTLSLFSFVILLGMWLERYLMVAPSIALPDAAPFNIWQPLVGCFFAGLMVLSVRWFLATFPAIQVWQPPVPLEMTEPEREAVSVERRSAAHH